VTQAAGSGGAAIWAIARADFLERVRRYSFLFTLGFALYLGYLTIVGNLVLQVGHVRGIFNSAWVGALLSVVASAFISLAGFYFVKNTIQRDRETRVGQILAATPLSKFIYVLGKVFSNLAVLTLMIGVLALSGIAMQLLRGEDRHIEIWNLVAPFVFLAFPAMVIVAAIAVLFETVPFLRGGFGNVAYFFVWTALLSVPLAVSADGSDLIGISLVANSARKAAHLSAENGGVTFSLSFGQIAGPLSTFRWDGLNWGADIILSRLAWVCAAFGIVTVGSALLFDRFDPSRGRALREASDARAVPTSETQPENGTAPVQVSAATLTPLAARSTHSRFVSLVAAELRLMLKGQNWWWYAVAIGLAIASAAAPSADARGILLTFAWIWPVLLWSSMGVRETRDQTYQLIFSAPHPISWQLPAVWLAGVLLALLTGGGFGLRLLLAGNTRGVLAWLGGALFIPTIALALGVWSGTGKPFEILYTLLWYVGPMHAIPQLDFMASAPATATTHYPLIYLLLTAVFGAAALAGRQRQFHS
jgi:hypothetical protein